MNRQLQLMIGMVIGAGLMYFLDPDRGRRRRALVRDQVVHSAHELEDVRAGVASRARHLRNRAGGFVHETRSRLRREEVDDHILEARVLSHLGRLVSDSSGITVSAEHGRVTLRGTAPEAEMTALIDGVQAVPGVHDVINRLVTPEKA